ncbi:MAG TPA: hypothetical protein VHM00_15775 [Caldimonas sp.]|jgi:hypothetical protein|nr:hypothetical protein [Caldimonas sp.]HEX2542530.1 hypothetical protein [Caldimonas sp.]
MKNVLRAALVGGALIVLAIALLALALSYGPYPDANIVIDGDAVSLNGLDGWHAVLVYTAAAMALVGFAIVALLAVIAGLAVALVVAFFGLAAGLVVLLVLMSPVLLVGWLVWCSLRTRRQAAPAPAPS